MVNSDLTTDVVIASAARTPIGKFQGALSKIPAPTLGAIAIRAAVERARIDPGLIDEVFLGNVIQAGEGQAPARQAALTAGIPPQVGATTINKVCGSGLKAVMLAASAIKAGEGEVFVAGGMENMNLAPYLLPGARSGLRMGHTILEDAMIKDGLWCACEQVHMGNLAEWVARKFEISRAEQDAYALRSHQRAVTAQQEGRFDAEIVGVPVKQAKAQVTITRDENPRPDTSLSALSALRPAFDPAGAVTAGNAPPISDGAAALLVMSAAKAAELGVRPLARILAYTQAAVAPQAIFTAPAKAIQRLLDKTHTSLADYNLFELNEAFAAQALANGQELGLDWTRVNVNGGAIALGHPIGASGARVLVTLLYALAQRQLQRGIAALCLGGGEAVALSVERIED